MDTSLEKLVNNLPETAFNNVKRYYAGDKFNLVRRKEFILMIIWIH